MNKLKEMFLNMSKKKRIICIVVIVAIIAAIIGTIIHINQVNHYNELREQETANITETKVKSSLSYVLKVRAMAGDWKSVSVSYDYFSLSGRACLATGTIMGTKNGELVMADFDYSFTVNDEGGILKTYKSDIDW